MKDNMPFVVITH